MESIGGMEGKGGRHQHTDNKMDREKGDDDEGSG
jgi:hypothetical protein